MIKAGRRALCVVCPIFVAAIFTLIAFLLFACAAPSRSLPQIVDIYSPKTVVEYDGLPHGISIRNVLATDSVYYSVADGEWQKNEIEYIEQGEYTVRYKIVRNGFADFIGFGELSIVRTELDGIHAPDITVIYDGLPHGIQIEGLLPDDCVTVSPADSFTDVGEYSVSYTVERSGAGYYVGSCKITVLPDIIGDYVNAYNGVIRITSNTVFDIHCNGTTDGKPFSVSDDVLTCDGAEYVKLGKSDRLYIFDVNGTRLYRIGGSAAVFSVELQPPTLIADGVRFTVSGEYNFVESVESDAAISDDGKFYTVTADGKTATVRILLTMRARKPLPDTEEIIVYDGKAHEIAARYDGKAEYSINGVTTSVLPTVTDIGVYEYSVTVYSDVYATETTAHRATVVLSGVYYSTDTIAEFDGVDAVINSAQYSVDYGNKTVASKALTTAGGSVIFGDERLSALDDGTLMSICVNGNTSVIRLAEARIDEMYASVTCDGQSVCVRFEDWNGLFYSRSLALSAVESVSITVNGVVPFYDEDCARYVLTPSELSARVTRIIIELR